MKRNEQGMWPRPPEPAELPVPLPRRLLLDLLARGKMLLCLDYDGTLSEIAASPAEARPVPLARELLSHLSRYPRRIEIAIVSGRDLDSLLTSLGLTRGLLLVGTHGFEIIGRDGRRLVASPSLEVAGNLESVRQWTRREIPAMVGFVIEDKRLAIALHYRSAEPSIAFIVRNSLRVFVDRECPQLEILEGKMVDEVIPRGVGGKGFAVRCLLDSMEESPHSVAYFGDDATDEDAFHELRDKGATVLVGERRKSWALYQVAGPSAVVTLLQELAIEVEAGPSGDSIA